MSARVTCGNCGARVELTAGYAKAKVRCPTCGYYAEVPPAARSAAPAADEPPVARPAVAKPVSAKPAVRAKRAIDPRDHRPRFEPDEPHGPPLLAGTDDYDDEKPYAVPGTGTKPCPQCRGELPLDASFCVHCGRDLTQPRAAVREYQPVRRTWTEGWGQDLRLMLLAGAVVIDVVAIGIVSVVSGDYYLGAFTMATQVALQSFILGTYDTVEVRRTARGQTTITRVRRIAFAPLPPIKVAWKGSHMVAIVATHDVGVFSWLTCIYLLFLGLVPGVVFYLVYLHPEKFDVIACDVHGGTDEVLLRLGDRGEAAKAAALISDVTGLVVRNELTARDLE
jgi:hypothetical protein